MTNPSDLDLELISVFEAILNLKSVSRAANELNTSQPAVSQALAKLRLHFNDQLFVRTSEGMIPTPCALALSPPLLRILRIYREQVQQRSSFDPDTSEQLFTIAASDIGELIFMPPLVQTLAAVAPKIQLRANRLEGGSLLESLQTGDVDLAIGSFPSLEAGIHARRLFTEGYVCMVREDHPVIRNQLTEDAFLSGSHILVEAHAVGHIHLRAERTIRKLIPSHMIKASSQSFLVAAFLLHSADCILTVPSQVAVNLASLLRLNVFPPPITFESFDVMLLWHDRFHRDPAHQWLRGLIAKLQRDSGA